MVYIAHIALEFVEIDPEKGETDYWLEVVDLGNLEHQSQENFENHKHPDTVDRAVRWLNMVDKREEDEKPRLEVRSYGFQVQR